MSAYVKGRSVVLPDTESWELVADPIENDKAPGTYVAPAKRESDGVLVALPMPADIALAWFMANPGNG